MADDISVAMRLSIILLLAGALLATVLNVSVPMVKWLTKETGKVSLITDISYNQLKGTKGKDMNAGRIYRYYMEIEDKIGLIAVREHPVTQPANYKLLVCKEKKAVTSALQPFIDAFDFSHRDTDYQTASTYFNNEMISKDFRVTVNVFPDGGLEIVCDLVDEFYDD